MFSGFQDSGERVKELSEDVSVSDELVSDEVNDRHRLECVCVCLCFCSDLCIGLWFFSEDLFEYSQLKSQTNPCTNDSNSSPVQLCV